MKKITLKQTSLALLLGAISIPTLAIADDACVALGGMVWDNWTQKEAGGPGALPAGEKSAGYVRCASCHGWDRLGLDGGYVRRARSATRPNAGLGDSDSSSRNIDTGVMGKHAPITAQMILHTGTGRSIAEGSGSWVEPITPKTAANAAAYAKGYTLGNQHPDYTGLLTEKQVSCLVEFLNSPDTQPARVFKRIATAANPTIYELVDTADAKAGKNYYEENCTQCHGAPDNDQSKTRALAPKGGFVAYLQQDARFSEFAHRARWGLPNTDMVPTNFGNPSAQDMASIMKYIQEFGKIPTKDYCGKSKSSVLSVGQDGKFVQDARLHLPRVSVSSATGDVDYWATLRYAPELSPKGNLVFELADVNANSGSCK
ncbi:MAG: c-type cytochrome [Methylococcaceae bacterium]|nr:c-type cytochrome [Methylococcaceae bacterium]